MSNAAWFHCFSGIAGDMALGSLIDAGADIDEVRRQLQALDVDGWSIDSEVVQRCGIRATHLLVDAPDEGHQHRPYRVIRDLIENSSLLPRVKERSQRIFLKLAESEAYMHGSTVEEVHFHEVGGVDAIIDIVGTCIALELLGIDHVYASEVATGTGTIVAAHGTLPVPVPAVVRLLHGVPLRSVDQPYELTTPTGAAIVAALAENFGPLPDFGQLVTSGFGAGTRDIDGLPNATQVLVGVLSAREATRVGGGAQPILLLETNVDDVTGEVLAYAVERLMAEGAMDAWTSAITMKKGRPAHTVHVLADAASVDHLATIVSHETGSLGIRVQQWERWTSRRQFDTVELDTQLIAVKSGPHRRKAEFEDAAALARESGRPLREVLAEAERQ